jgi:hypothetical protein
VEPAGATSPHISPSPYIVNTSPLLLLFSSLSLYYYATMDPSSLFNYSGAFANF